MTDGQTDGQNYDSQDRASIAASRGNNGVVLRTIYILNNNEFVAVSSKYDIDLCNLSECVIK